MVACPSCCCANPIAAGLGMQDLAVLAAQGGYVELKGDIVVASRLRERCAS